MRFPTMVAAVAVLLAVSAQSRASAAPSAAAESAARSEANLRDFDFVVDMIRTSYAGWNDKVTENNRAAFDATTASLRARAAKADDKELEVVLKAWTDLFKDGHTGIGRVGPGAATASVKTSEPNRSPRWTEAFVLQRLAALGADRRPVEGIWSIAGDRYRVGVLRDSPDGRRFKAVVLTTTAEGWRPGDVKAVLETTTSEAYDIVFYAGDRSAHEVGATVLADGTALRVEGWGVWLSEAPVKAEAERVARFLPADELFLTRVSPSTLWLRVPDFDGSRAEPLKALIAKWKPEIERTPNLIIDLRENGGGADFVYEPLSELIYTQPVYGVAAEMRSSAMNIRLRSAVAEQVRPQSPETAAMLDRQIEQMRARPGGFVQQSDRGVFIDADRTRLAFPKRVAVLIDGAGSTGEQFLLEAMQSRKTTLLGQANSAGVLDYANVVSTPTPSGRFQVYWATSRSLRLPEFPVDPDGIAPDVRIPADEKDPITWTAAWLERIGTD